MIGIFPVWVCSLEIYTWWPAKNKVNSSLKLSSRSFWYTSMTSWGERHSGEKWSVIANWEEEEKYWIMTYRAYGNKLTNRPCLGTEATNRWVFKGKTLDQSDFGAVGSTQSLPSEIFLMRLSACFQIANWMHCLKRRVENWFDNTWNWFQIGAPKQQRLPFFLRS